MLRHYSLHLLHSNSLLLKQHQTLFSNGAAAASLLSLASAASSRRHLEQILAGAITNSQLPSDLILTTKLADRFSSLGDFDAALSLLPLIPSPDRFLINVLLRSAASAHRPSTAFSLFSLSLKSFLNPDAFTFSFAFSAAGQLSSPDRGRSLHALAIIQGFSGNPFVGSALCSFYLSFSFVSIARNVFDRITQPDTVCFNTLISGLSENSHYSDSLEAFKNMLGSSIRPDLTSLAIVLPSAAELRDHGAGLMLHCLSLKLGFGYHSFVVTGLISMYTKCGEVSAAEYLFDQVLSPDLVTWNAMISGYSSNGQVVDSVMLFKELLGSGGRASSSTIVGLIPVQSPFGHEWLCQTIHGLSIKSGLDLNPASCTAITTIYARLNNMECARRAFDSMPDKTIASWNAMISAYAQNGLTEMAVSLFKQMQKLNIQPNPTTVTSILSACSQLGALSLGKWVRRIIAKENLEVNVFVSTALIDMYAKCGNITEARRIFDTVQEKNVVTWNAMLSGYGLHGQGYEALKLFEQMLNTRITPNAVTFLSIMHGCSHAGLVKEGQEIFYSMDCNHGIKPGSEHYACMVDLLGRAGQLESALDFINEIPKDSGHGVWGAFLGACMIHKETSLAQLASRKLLELEPENPGYHVLLANVYSATRSYKQAAAVREALKKKNMSKTPGCSLIEINDLLHVFTADDRSHPDTTLIHFKLEEIMAKIIEAGYRPETSAALYDVEEEEKGDMVRVHSEKLAITFAILRTRHGSEIRIIKNLRVCLDCHNWTKFVSKDTERVIVVRDANRFHHFREGFCSCGDYW